MNRFAYGVLCLLLYAATLWPAYERDSLMFAALFVIVLGVSAAFYLFEFGKLREIRVRWFQTHVHAVQAASQEAEAGAAAIEELRAIAAQAVDDVQRLQAQLVQVSTQANTAYHSAMQQSGVY